MLGQGGWGRFIKTKGVCKGATIMKMHGILIM